MNKGIITVAIGKEVIKIDTEAEAAIHDINADMDTVSARIAWFGELLAAAEEEAIKVDAAYRRWRAGVKVEALKKEKGIAEWKVDARIEASEQFTKYKAAIGKAKYNCVALRGLVDALKEKSPNLRSKGARQRAELDSTNMSTPAQRTASERKEELRTLRGTTEDAGKGKTPSTPKNPSRR